MIQRCDPCGADAAAGVSAPDRVNGKRLPSTRDPRDEKQSARERGGDGERRINDLNRIFSFDSCSSASGHVTRSELIYIAEVDPVHVQVWERSIGRLHSSVCAPRLATRVGRTATVALPLYRANARNNRTNRELNYSARATGGRALEIETNAFTLRSHKVHGRAEISEQRAESAKTNGPARTKRHPSNEFRYNRCLRAQIKLICTLQLSRERAHRQTQTHTRALARLTASASHQEAAELGCCDARIHGSNL